MRAGLADLDQAESMPMKSALAVAAHPDDIEFCMAGTLLLLKQAGWEIHCLNVASGNCGSVKLNASPTRIVRRQEARRAARTLGAQWHPPLCDDLEILYRLNLLRRVAAVIRKVKPAIVLTHSPEDYMEDHTNTCRLAVTAAFARGMRNFRTRPARKHLDGDVTVYHAMPHGLRDGMGRRIIPECFVNTVSVHELKFEALACHRSQKEWLDVSQGMDSYLRSMEEMSLEVGRMSKGFKHAEGWRRHGHLGLCRPESDPLGDALGIRLRVHKAYPLRLDQGR